MPTSVIYLDSPVTDLKFISTNTASKLTNLDIYTVRDLILHFPRYHKDHTAVTLITNLIDTNQKYTIEGQISNFKNRYLRRKLTVQTATVADTTGKLKVSWFNQPFLEQSFKNNPQVRLSGKVKQVGKDIVLNNPEYEIIREGRSIHLDGLAPTYALTTGITGKWLRRRIFELLNHYTISDLNSLLDDQLSLNIIDALKLIHFPPQEDKLQQAQHRLSIEELTTIMLKALYRKAKNQRNSAPVIAPAAPELNQIIKDLPFELTPDQLSTVEEIQQDMAAGKPMDRLVQGDVGSGKTIVAALAAISALKAGYQVVFLAPTVVLAQQQYQILSSLLFKIGIKIKLIVGGNKNKESGDLLVGTTAILASKDKLIHKLGLLIVDEQHKFGVKQRRELIEYLASFKKIQPHLLDMTATPIPRTVALTLFGDQDLTLIKSKPRNRLPIITKLVPQTKRSQAHSWIDEQLQHGTQAYWICPLVEDSETTEAKSVKATFEELTKIFPQHHIGLLHGKMKDSDKISVMQKFKDGEISLLVSTSVVEVGIDVPNATIMVIENADRFGLAQLHQIRGRVGRGSQQSWCFLFTSPDISELAMGRLNFFADNTDGLKIAEFDLQTRGPGEVYGTKQSGIPNLRIATMNNLEILEQAKTLSQQLFKAKIKSLQLFT